ncbi:hypothetical protein [Hymenobacter yonginensis]|uniref:Lipoprotein n=1 Tax=Hymenobacter yonginensis TaxID=748197 RepID=A0ABY7PSJ2_9BACT|nr:hypothetical protein [Hymenobacter yonginensis]WBO85567.1 hypothetical protein O9Z63_04820 [Hymenobacter yonginensis]
MNLNSLMKRNVLCLLTALLLLSCQENKPKEIVSDSTIGQINANEVKTPALLEPKGQKREYVILPFSEKPDYMLKGAASTQLTAEDIDEVYRLVQGAVDKYNTEQAHLGHKHSAVDLRRYRLQLIPALNAKGEKAVWVNAFCSNAPTNWEKSLVVVNDGGNCFFQVSVNLLWKKWSDFGANGEA